MIQKGLSFHPVHVYHVAVFQQTHPSTQYTCCGQQLHYICNAYFIITVILFNFFFYKVKLYSFIFIN